MANSNSKKILYLLALVVVAGAAWFFVSPLFLDEVVDEEFVLPTREKIAAMDDDQHADEMERAVAAMEKKADAPMDEPMDGAGPVLVKRGSFRDGDSVHRGSGDALVYRLSDGSHILRFENFKVTNGPALVVYLAEHPDPMNAEDVKTHFDSLGKLKGNVGNQNYTIPADMTIDDVNSVVIWCELFDVLFAPAALTETAT